jgi:hypothetical protein
MEFGTLKTAGFLTLHLTQTEVTLGLGGYELLEQSIVLSYVCNTLKSKLKVRHHVQITIQVRQRLCNMDYSRDIQQ